MAQLVNKKCLPCEAGTPPLDPENIQELLSELKGGWELEQDKKIFRKFKFESFREAITFVNRVADLAEDEGHHPDIHIYYRRVVLELTTHAIKGLSENDFIMASKIDLLYGWKEELEKYAAKKIQKIPIRVLAVVVTLLAVVTLILVFTK